MAGKNLALNLWHRLSPRPGGKWLFSRIVCFRAPYFATIRPRFRELRAGCCVVTMRKRRAVHNHLGTVHAIALCNLAEVAGGTMTEVSVPASHRWIPRGMTVEYLAKATSDLQAVARLDPLPEFGDAGDVAVPVEVLDSNDQLVFRATITMYISPRA